METEILLDFKGLDVSDPNACDKFFEKYGVGNDVIAPTQSLDRYNHYRSLLFTLQQADERKYTQMHKGTPLYFLGWIAFDLKNYSAAISFMTAALAEDEEKSAGEPFDTWIQNPAGKNMLLDSSGTSAARIVDELKEVVVGSVELFNTADESCSLSVENLVAGFIRPMLKDKKYELVASLYAWLLEYRENYKNLQIISGAVPLEPVIIHLFKGALICETILKHYYTENMDSGRKAGQPVKTLGEFMYSSGFTSAFPGVTLSGETNSLQEIADRATDNTFQTTMSNTAKIRNTTGHKLLWDNPFSDPENYKKLFEQELFAIFHVVNKQLLVATGK